MPLVARTLALRPVTDLASPYVTYQPDERDEIDNINDTLETVGRTIDTINRGVDTIRNIRNIFGGETHHGEEGDVQTLPDAPNQQ